MQLPEGSGEDADALVLMLSELATNAVRHAATEYVVSVRVADGGRHVLVEVSDAAGGYPVPQEQAGDAPHGRGLHIVQTLADAWGIEMQRDRPGKTVWFSSGCPAGTVRPGRLSRRPASDEGLPERRHATGGDRATPTAPRPRTRVGTPSRSCRTGPCPPCGRCSTA